MIYRRIDVGSVRILATKLNGEAYGHLALEILMSFQIARAERRAVYFLRPRWPANRALLDFRGEGVQLLGRWHPVGALVTLPWRVSRWLRDAMRPWHRQRVGPAARRRSDDARYPDWYRQRAGRVAEWYHVRPDETFPPDAPYYQRLLIREKGRSRLIARRERQATAIARKAGIDPDRPLVTLHVREAGFKQGRETTHSRADSTRNAHVENYFPAIDLLVARGYQVVRVGDPTMRPLVRPGVVDVATWTERRDLLDVWCLTKSRFLVGCESGPYGVIPLTDTPIVVINCTDPISSFPIRSDQLHILKRVRELATGRILSLTEMLSDAYLTHLRDLALYEYIENTPEEIYEAVEAMIELLDRHPPETDSQRQYKALVVEAALRLREVNPYVRKWGPDNGFMGDGRLVEAFTARYLTCGDSVPVRTIAS